MNSPRSIRAITLASALLMLAACDRRDDALAGCRLNEGATVLAIGDSLTRGHGADGAGYAEQLQALLAQQPGRGGIVVANLGIDGETSAGLLARIDDALAEHRPAVVLITSGGNDFLRRVAAGETRQNLHDAVERVRGSGAHAIVFGIPRASLAAAVGALSEHEIYAELADAGAAHVIEDVVSEVLSRTELKSDRIHPNREGYARMAQAASEALQRCH